MGKRELVLVIAFVVVGALVYQFTAPPPSPGRQRGSVWTNLKRAVSRGGHATVTSTHAEPVDASIKTLHVNTRLLDLRVVGEDRADVAVELTVTSDGMDDADAARLAHDVTAIYTRTGDELVLTMDYPSAGAQHSAIVARVPRGIALRVDPKSGRLDIADVAAVEVKNNRGDTRISGVARSVDVTARAGALTIDGAGSLHGSVLSGSGTIAHVSGAASLELTAADLTLSDITGPLDIRARGGRVQLKASAALTGLLRLDTTAGRLDIDALQTDARIDGTGTAMRISMARPATVTVYNTADDITFVPPPGGYTLDAVATDGDLSIDEGEAHGVAVAKASDSERRASGPVHGGGPVITLRNTRGDIAVRARTGK